MRRNRFRPSVALPLITLLLTIAFAGPAQAAFPGANGKIIFTVLVGDSQSEFNVMNADGTGVTRLTDFGGLNTSPAWSPDGTKVAFQTNLYGDSDYDYDIAVMNADGSRLTRLTTTGGQAPTWSPDGTKIGFAGPGGAMYVMNADGTGVTRLRDSGGSPSWSPDGSKIAFARDFRIYVMNADGTGVTQLINSTYGTDPDWSPDGTKILFTGYDYAGNELIYVMNADGTGVTTLRRSGRTTNPNWSPDGTKIALVCYSQELPGIGICAMNPDGSGETFLGGSPDNEASPDLAWQPLPAAVFKNRAKECKAEGKRGRELGACVSGRP